MTKIWVFAATAVLAGATTAYPAPPPAQCVKQSPRHTIALIELYTSLDREWITKHLGVAAFVQDFGNGEILQATALPVCTQ